MPASNKQQVANISEKIALYDKLVATNPEIERKGDTNPYTSCNGHMFSHLAPPGTLALRLPPDEVDRFIKKYESKLFEAYGVLKKDWVVVPDGLLRKTAELRPYFELSYRHAKSLKPKAMAKKSTAKKPASKKKGGRLA